ncbi:DNA polymerase III subunit delta [Oceanithermus sp.]
MIVSFTGDPFLARRAARAEAEVRGLEWRLLPPDPVQVQQAASGGLFGPGGAIVDLREVGEAEWKELRAVLEKLPEDAVVLLYDPKPTAARSRWLGKHSEKRDHPTPRYREKQRWVAAEMKRMGLKAPAAVVQYLGQLEADLEAIHAELEKLALLEGELTLERVRQIVALEPPMSSFDLVDAAAAGRFEQAMKLLRGLLERGEEPLRILGALSKHYTRAAALWAELQNRNLSDKDAAALLKIHPFAARKLLAFARRLDEDRLLRALDALGDAERAAKTGRDPVLALERVLLALRS